MGFESLDEVADLGPSRGELGFLDALDDGLGRVLERDHEVYSALDSQRAVDAWVDVGLGGCRG